MNVSRVISKRRFYLSFQELIAYGLANTVSSFFSCFPSAASLSRSVIQEALGSTQVKLYLFDNVDNLTFGLHVFFIRNHFISNLVLDSLKFTKLLELHGES